MKTLRIFLLLLLAVLLPVRGAVAAAMLCPIAGPGTQSEVRVHDHSNGHSAMQPAAGIEHSEHHDLGLDAAGDADGGSVSTADPCNLCSAFCSVPPLVDSRSRAFMLPETASAPLPTLSARAPSFLSDGPERPPRSI